MIAIFSLLPIFAYAIAFNIFFKKTVSTSIFFSITSIITILFIFGMLDILSIGRSVLFYGGILLLPLLSIIYKNDVLKFIRSVPFVIYLLSSMIYLYLIQDAQLFFWDEYSHWGAFIKEMYYFDAFYDASSVAGHINYPPGISIWDYFVIFPTQYHEGSLYFAYFLILFSSTLMMYERLSFGQIHWIGLIFSIQMIVFANFGHWFSCIYVDHVVGSLFAGLILSFFVDKYKPYELFLFLFPLISIVLVKEIGLYFGLSHLGLVLLLLISREKADSKHSMLFVIKQHKYIILILFTLFLSMVLALKSWETRQDNLGVKKETQTITAVAKAIFSGKKVLSKEDEKEAKKRLTEVILYQQLHKEKISLNYNEFSYDTMQKYKKDIKLSTVGSFLFFIIICLSLFFIADTREKKIETAIVGGYLLFVGIVYFVILYFSFFVAFGSSTLRIPSYVRYINIGILPLMLVGFSLFLPIMQKDDNTKKVKYKKNTKHKHFVYSAGLLFVLVLITEPYMKPLYSQLKNPFRQVADDATQNIIKSLPQKAKLFVVFPVKNNGSLNNILKYSLIPLRATISSSNFPGNSARDMMAKYEKYEYIWFASLDEQLATKNKNILKMKNKKELFKLYKIGNKNNKLEFEPIL